MALRSSCSPTTSPRSAVASPGGWRSWPSGTRPAPSWSPPASTRTPPTWTPPSPTGWTGCRLPARRLRSLQGLLFWSRRAAVLTRECGVEFIWCGNMKPAAYPGEMDHGASRHAVRRPAARRRPARSCSTRSTSRCSSAERRARSSSSAAVLVANSRWTRERCLTLLSELELEAGERQVQVVPLGADHVFFRPGVDTTERARALRTGRGPLAALGRAAGAPQGHRHRAPGARAPGGAATPTCATRWSDRAKSSSALEEEARELGVGDRVRFLTDVPDRDLPAHLQLRRGVSRRVEADGAAGRGVRHLHRRGVGLRHPGGRGPERRHPRGGAGGGDRIAGGRGAPRRRWPKRSAVCSTIATAASPARRRRPPGGGDLLQLGPCGRRPRADRPRVRRHGAARRRSH